MSSATAIKVYIPDDEHIWVQAEIYPSAQAGDGWGIQGGSGVTSADNGLIEVLITDDAYQTDESNSNSRSPSPAVPLEPISRRRKKINVAKVLKPFGMSSLPLQNANFPADGVPDMVDLGYLHEGSILDNLKRRFKSRLPYTYTGDICLAVNPYQWLDNYTQDIREKYSKHYRYQLPPHVYGISAQAYRGVRDNRRNQSILVSGESGAGKTETVKILMGHIANIASMKDDRTVGKVLEANPLLESFGNAKTVRNDNSSRFGKFIELQFNKNSILVGSKSVTYLLEKTRVVTQTSLERNYHIIYQLLAAPSAVTDTLHLTGRDASYFTYTSQGDLDTRSIEGCTDADRFLQTMSELSLLGIDGALKLWLQRGLAGMLYLGQIIFEGQESDQFGSADNAVVSEKTTEAQERLQACCSLLDVSVDDFKKAVTARKIEVRGQRFDVPLTIEQATSSRDALAKEIYSRIFQWLVHVINFNTSVHVQCTCKSVHTCGLGFEQSHRIIGLLDIFGFESFVVNRFEQLMINYANEKLQQKFTQDVFKTVQREYREEGLKWENIDFRDNSEVLDLIEGKKGILSILNEECLIPKSTDSSFLSKIKVSCGTYNCFNVGLLTRDEFVVKHYAGSVSYVVYGFLDKNKDTMPEDLRQLLSTSASNLLATLFSQVGGNLLFNSSEEVQIVDRETMKSLLLLDENATQSPTERMALLSTLSSNIHSPLGQYSSPMASPAAGSQMTESFNPSSPSVVSSPTADSGVLRRRRSFLESTPPTLTSASSIRVANNKRRMSSFMLAETVAMKFKSQLANLLDTITATEVQYVRCFKPNANKSSLEFNSRMVVEQLRSSGVIEAISVSRAAYPNHLTHEEFYLRFGVLKKLVSLEGFDQSHESPSNDNDLSLVHKCNSLLDGLVKSDLLSIDDLPPRPVGSKSQLYECGKTRIYFSLGVLDLLESLRTMMLQKQTIKVQKVYRGHVQYQQYKEQKAACAVIQKNTRMALAKLNYQRKRSAAINIQCFRRRCLLNAIRKERRAERAARTIQSLLRMKKDRDEYRRKKNAANKIASLAKMLYKRKRYIVMRDKEREDKRIRDQLQILQVSLENEINLRKNLVSEVTRITRWNEELNKSLQMHNSFMVEEDIISFIEDDPNQEEFKNEDDMTKREMNTQEIMRRMKAKIINLEDMLSQSQRELKKLKDDKTSMESTSQSNHKSIDSQSVWTQTDWSEEDLATLSTSTTINKENQSGDKPIPSASYSMKKPLTRDSSHGVAGSSFVGSVESTTHDVSLDAIVLEKKMAEMQATYEEEMTEIAEEKAKLILLRQEIESERIELQGLRDRSFSRRQSDAHSSVTISRSVDDSVREDVEEYQDDPPNIDDPNKETSIEDIFHHLESSQGLQSIMYVKRPISTSIAELLSDDAPEEYYSTSNYKVISVACTIRKVVDEQGRLCIECTEKALSLPLDSSAINSSMNMTRNMNQTISNERELIDDRSEASNSQMIESKAHFESSVTDSSSNQTNGDFHMIINERKTIDSQDVMNPLYHSNASQESQYHAMSSTDHIDARTSIFESTLTFNETVNKFRFSISDLKSVSCSKGMSIKIPDSVPENLCMSLLVEGMEEINIIMASENVRDQTAQLLLNLMGIHAMEQNNLLPIDVSKTLFGADSEDVGIVHDDQSVPPIVSSPPSPTSSIVHRPSLTPSQTSNSKSRSFKEKKTPAKIESMATHSSSLRITKSQKLDKSTKDLTTPTRERMSGRLSKTDIPIDKIELTPTKQDPPSISSSTTSSLSPMVSPTWKYSLKDVNSPVAAYIYGTSLRASATIVMKGWGAKEDKEQVHLHKAWKKHFFALERETKQLKYGISEAFVIGSGQVRGFIQIDSSMKCHVCDSRTSLWIGVGSGRYGYLEITSPSGSVLRMQVDHEKEASLWVTAIVSVISGIDIAPIHEHKSSTSMRLPPGLTSMQDDDESDTVSVRSVSTVASTAASFMTSSTAANSSLSSMSASKSGRGFTSTSSSIPTKLKPSKSGRLSLSSKNA